MIADWELWACAAHIEKHHDDRAPAYVAERIGALALAGDVEGVSTWRAIAARYQQMGVATRRVEARQ